MLEKLFKSSNGNKSAEVEAKHRAVVDLDAEIERLESDPAIVAVRRAKELEYQIANLKEQRRRADSDARQLANELDAEQRRPARQKITPFIRWAEEEKARARREVQLRGHIERDRLGLAHGLLSTNQRKIQQYVESLDAAIAQAKLLETGKLSTIDDEISKVRGGIQPLDVSLEEIKCDAGLAQAIS